MIEHIFNNVKKYGNAFCTNVGLLNNLGIIVLDLFQIFVKIQLGNMCTVMQGAVVVMIAW
jgi:hypothetical protein